ncbi:hypothetical protein [Chroococcidiopsis sp.]
MKGLSVRCIGGFQLKKPRSFQASNGGIRIRNIAESGELQYDTQFELRDG